MNAEQVHHWVIILIGVICVSCWVVFYTSLPEKLISLIRNFRK